MFQLKQLGPFRIERTEEYIPGAQDNTYAEMIRVRGSKPEPPYFVVPSHLFKYSETELGLYLHERKNLWRQLGRLLNIETEISDPELMARFPISMFTEVVKIVPFVKKRGTGELSPAAIARRDALNAVRHTEKMKRNAIKFNERAHDGNITPPLDSFAIKEGSE